MTVQTSPRSAEDLGIDWVDESQNTFRMDVETAQRHEIHVTDLQSTTAYRYRIRIPAEGEGTSFTASFRSAPNEGVPITFAVYGDSREEDENDRDNQSVAEAIEVINPNFVIHTGDLDNYGDSERFWTTYWGTVAPDDGHRFYRIRVRT